MTVSPGASPPTLITVSGMVGAGKSTWVSNIVEQLARDGIVAERLPFRRRSSRDQHKTSGAGKMVESDGTGTTPGVGARWSGFRPRRLSALTALGYAGRTLLFRARFWRRKNVLVLDRYFYDSFVHYRLSTHREQLYMALLGRLIPTPDLAILLLAEATTVAGRRPDYAIEYVEPVSAAYARLPRYFPALIPITTDGSASVKLDDLLQRLKTPVRNRRGPGEETRTSPSR